MGITLKAIKREDLTKSTLNQIRKKDVPAVIYGNGENRNITINQTEFTKAYEKAGKHQLIDVELEGKKHSVIIKDYAIDNISRKFIHADLYEIREDKQIKTMVPIQVKGVPAGVKEGGVLGKSKHQTLVRCLPKDIPNAIEHDISAMQIGDTLQLKNLSLPEGVELMEEGRSIVCSVVGSSTLKKKKDDEETEETAAE